ncbi:MAG: MBL fold metallo-hydrolase [Betaproteobacteria bacterium]|jgi:glyoxylase-like metal-dependent hydrolase (beta-lactamase superfamily II)/8-oxo-dGTP pyrophosphatase MutT (NUDIX family)|nr:MBL fold metallo-hydrolase [Rubrivivax sp.]
MSPNRAPAHATPADARRAASLILLRDGERGPEVLMLRRAERDGDIRSGVTVFPGGVLDPRDREAHGRVHGADDATLSARLGLPEGGLDYAIAAVRETFEEVGLLIAREADGRSVTAARAQELAPWRDRLHRNEASVPMLCEATGLTLDLSGLVYHSHWLTPPGAPKRFDTRFFIAAAPEGQQAVPDLGEAVELMWLTPSEALSRERGLKLLPVTEVTLRELSAFADTAAALAASRARGTVPCVMPRRALRGGRPTVVLPHELPYAEIGRLDPEGRADALAELLPGRLVWLSPRVARLTAPNPGPMTGPGTNSYLVGSGRHWVVIDPGPALEPHVQALVAALPAAAGGRPVAILATHTHRDHSPAAAPLAAATGAPVWGRRPGHPMWQDDSFRPDHEPADGERLELGEGVTLHAVHTPGHASNHLCWWLEQERLLFTGDHVMQGSTVVINPPDGDMAAYLHSLQALRRAHDAGARPLEWLAPGHGFLVADPPAVLDALVAHRLRREAKVLAALKATPRLLEALLPRVYDDVPAALHGVAARSLLAHLLKLQGEGRAVQAAEGWSGGP